MNQRERILAALAEARRYVEMTDDSLESGSLDDAEGWLRAMIEEVATSLKTE